MEFSALYMETEYNGIETLMNLNGMFQNLRFASIQANYTMHKYIC